MDNEKISEDLKVSIGVESTGNYNIIDKPYNLTILESAEASVMTDLINGKLCAFIITTNKIVDVEISFKGLVIYRNMALPEGTHYVPVMIDAIAPNDERLNFGVAPFYLNDNLLIVITGQRQTSVEVIVRHQ